MSFILALSTRADATASDEYPRKFDVFAAYDGIGPPEFPLDSFAGDYGQAGVPKEKLGALISYYTGSLPVKLRVEEVLTFERLEEERLLLERMNQVFLFADASTEKELAPSGPKNWSPEDKQKIKAAYEKVALACPNLIYRAAHNKRIKLFRLTKDGLSDTPQAIAFTGFWTDSGIWFTDLIFEDRSWTVEQTVAHELTHMADCKSRISEMNEWSNLQSRKISDLRRELSLNRTKKLDNALARRFGLPTLDCCKSLSEALAVCTSIYIFDHNGVDKVTRDFIENRLLSFEGANFETRAMALDHLYRTGQYEKCTSEADAIIKLDPESVYPRAMKLLAEAGLRFKREDNDNLERLLVSRAFITLDPNYTTALVALYGFANHTHNLERQSYLLEELCFTTPANLKYKADKKAVDKRLAIANRARTANSRRTTGRTSRLKNSTRA